MHWNLHTWHEHIAFAKWIIPTSSDNAIKKFETYFGCFKCVHVVSPYSCSKFHMLHNFPPCQYRSDHLCSPAAQSPYIDIQQQLIDAIYLFLYLSPYSTHSPSSASSAVWVVWYSASGIQVGYVGTMAAVCSPELSFLARSYWIFETWQRKSQFPEVVERLSSWRRKTRAEN